MNANLQALRAAAEQSWDAELTAKRQRVSVVHDTSSVARGSLATIASLRDAVAQKDLAVDIVTTGSWGFCWLEPTLTVRSADGRRTVLYGNVTADRVPDFVQKVLIQGEDLPELAIGVVEGEASAGIVNLDDHPFMRGQVRRLMANLGIIDPENIDHYLARRGYEGFERALELSDEEIIKEMLDSGLGGRGGGGFPAGRKWDFLRTATANPKYLVCNADEGDPGAWVNRVLMEGDPHLIIEGLLIAARATGAAEAYIYVRHEYPLSISRLRTAVAQAHERGLLGHNILGSGLDFEVIVFQGAGSYVCGEETGLINSIDGYRGMPRIRPPFPAQAGLWNKPTNVNNVETYANAPLIMREGAAWWSRVGGVKEKGTKMFTLSGQIRWQGCFEIPFGATVGSMLHQYGGGMKPGSVLKGYQPGGPLSGILPADEVELPTLLDPFRERGMFLGSGGIVFFDQHTSIIDLCLYMATFCEDESCGRCTTCHGGTQRAVEMLRRIADGGGRETDIAKFEDLIQTLMWSNCLHGQFALTCVKLALRYFKDEFISVIRDKEDPTRSLPGFIQYAVKNAGVTELAAAREICPTAAFVGEGAATRIDQKLCVKCGACLEVAPNAIEKQDRIWLSTAQQPATTAV